MFEFEIDLKNYQHGLPITHRDAARGIIRINNKFLLIYSTVFKDYKFPGGGVNENESLTDALIREVLEETGYSVIPETIKKAGIVLEKRHNPNNNSIYHMINHYFYCEVKEHQAKQNLDKYEKDRNYVVVYEELENVILNNLDLTASMKNMDLRPWIVRETKVMEILKEEK